MAGADDPRRVWAAAIAGATTMFAVQPPLDVWWLAWLAPLPWLALVAAPELPGSRPWLAIWVGGFAHWLLAIHWLRLPHPATGLGWVALSAYLGLYVPLFIWGARRLVHARGWPLVPAAVAAWMATEQVRGSLLGGFTFAMLGHTQWRWTTVLQVADAVGEVGVGGIVMGIAAAAAVAGHAAGGRRPVAWIQPLGAVAVLAAAVAYGHWRLRTAPVPAGRPLDVLLVQGSIDTELKHDPAASADVARHYDDLTMLGLAAADGRPPDLVVWPETMWRWALLEIDPSVTLAEHVVEELVGPDAADGVDRQARCRELLERERLDPLSAHARRYATRWLVGVDRQVVNPRAAGGVEHHNCGLFLESTGEPLACYSKMHPVMFGEYVPLADSFPFLYRITPLPASLTAGTEPVAVPVAGYEVAPTICYETALPGAIRSLVRRLAASGSRPDVIVNLTNDGWFWGSSELDMHLTAAIFRAVEVRTPIAIAANTGFSAAIDGSGRLLARGPRRAAAPLRVAVSRDGRRSPWLAWGSLPIWACVTVVAAMTLAPGRAGAARGRLGGDPPAGGAPA
ncbi:MAG: apolipoprotein N-acyltransferase [Planctomycetota bacterium]